MQLMAINTVTVFKVTSFVLKERWKDHIWEQFNLPLIRYPWENLP